MKAFIEEVGNILNIPQTDLIEKDIILHNILLSLSENDFFRDNLLFKGGTCLIKSYLGYYRFSEDLDFTWRDQSVFENLSQKRVRRYLSALISDTGAIFEEISNSHSFDFVSDKSDRRYVELGGSNKLGTFKLWYDSDILKYPTFVKVQINFVEKILYPPVDNKLRSLISDITNNSLELFFPDEYARYSRIIRFPSFEQREILCEKVRAVLTRRGIKARDFLDVYLLSKRYDIDVVELKTPIVEKVLFSLRLYEKYTRNLQQKIELINSGEIFEWGGERGLLLREIDENNYHRFIRGFLELLKEIANEVGNI